MISCRRGLPAGHHRHRHLLGVRSDHERVKVWFGGAGPITEPRDGRGHGSPANSSVREFGAYFVRSGNAPVEAARDDLISRLAAPRRESPADRRRAGRYVPAPRAGGHYTTPPTAEGMALLMIGNPDQFTRVGATRRCARAQSRKPALRQPVAVRYRTTREPATIGDVTIPANHWCSRCCRCES